MSFQEEVKKYIYIKEECEKSKKKDLVDDETGKRFATETESRAKKYIESKKNKIISKEKGPREMPYIDVKKKLDLAWGKKIKGDDEYRAKDKPSFMPQTQHRLTDLETKYDSNDKKQGDSAEHDAELYADLVCKKEGKPMTGSYWNSCKKRYLRAWDKGPEALKLLKKKL